MSRTPPLPLFYPYVLTSIPSEKAGDHVRSGVTRCHARLKSLPIIEPRDEDLDDIAAMLKDLGAKGNQAWAFVNNHF